MRINKMRRWTACAVAAALTFSAAPLFGAPAPRRGQPPNTASLAGTAANSAGQTLPNVTVQLRNLSTGQLAGTTTSSAVGAFSFTGLPAGNFAIEVVNAAGQIIGTSPAVAVAAGSTITGVTVSVSTAATTAGAAAATGAAGTGLSTAAITGITIAAGAGIVAAVAIAKHDSSPSK